MGDLLGSPRVAPLLFAASELHFAFRFRNDPTGRYASTTEAESYSLSGPIERLAGAAGPACDVRFGQRGTVF